MSTDHSMAHLYESSRERKRREAASHNAAHPVHSCPIETHSETRKARRRMQMLRGMLTPTHEVPDVYGDDDGATP